MNRGMEYKKKTQEDGFYGDGCKPHFFSCQGSAMYKVSLQLFITNYSQTFSLRGEEVARIVWVTLTLLLVSANIGVLLGLVLGSLIYAFQMDCPTGLYYDVSRKACDHKEEIAECGGNE